MPQSHPSKLASQMLHLNEATMMSKPASFSAKQTEEKFPDGRGSTLGLVMQESSMDSGLIRASYEQP